MHLHSVVGTLIVGTALSQLRSDKGTQFVGTLAFEQRPSSLTDAQMRTNRVGIGTQIDRMRDLPGKSMTANYGPSCDIRRTCPQKRASPSSAKMAETRL